MDTLDPTLDFPMIEYLKTGRIPDEYEEKDKIALISRSDDYFLELYRLK